jgi:hypothetical protein
MLGLLVLASALWFADNAEFVATVEEQLEEGFKWHAIECRDVNEELPAITINTPTGRKIVCHKLQ